MAATASSPAPASDDASWKPRTGTAWRGDEIWAAVRFDGALPFAGQILHAGDAGGAALLAIADGGAEQRAVLVGGDGYEQIADVASSAAGVAFAGTLRSAPIGDAASLPPLAATIDGQALAIEDGAAAFVAARPR